MDIVTTQIMNSLMAIESIGRTRTVVTQTDRQAETTAIITMALQKHCSL